MVKATYYTDPFCPWCWAAEPSLRRLQSEFDVEVTYVIGGLSREIDARKAHELARASLDAAAESGQPIDARVWLEDAPRSTYPAGIAFHAVAEQADPAPFLRRVREAVQLERRRMDRADGLLDAAREAGGLDLERLRVDFGSHAFVERFGEDLERARGVELPTIEFEGLAPVAGWRSDAWRAAALQAGAQPLSAGLPDVEAAVRRYGSISTVEVAAVTGLPGTRVAAELWRLAADLRVSPRRVPGGEVWAAA